MTVFYHTEGRRQGRMGLPAKLSYPGAARWRERSPANAPPLPVCAHRTKDAVFRVFNVGRPRRQPAEATAALFGPLTYGATRPPWRYGLAATVRNLRRTQIEGGIMEEIRVSIRQHPLSVEDHRAARVTQFYRQEQEVSRKKVKRCPRNRRRRSTACCTR